MVNALINNEQVKFGYQRPVKAVALDPEYGRKGTRQLVAGGAQAQLSMIEKGWFGNKDVVIHAGEGTIHAIKWRGTLIAWANDTVRCGLRARTYGGRRHANPVRRAPALRLYYPRA